MQTVRTEGGQWQPFDHTMNGTAAATCAEIPAMGLERAARPHVITLGFRKYRL